MEAAASLIAACYSSCLISCARGQETQTRVHVSCVKSIPRVKPSPCVENDLCVIVLQSAEAALGLDAFIAPPEPRGLGGHLGFPKIWVAREMRSRRQAGRAEQGGLNNIVGFQFCEMIIAAFSRPPGAWYNTLHNLLYGWSKSI